MVCCCQNLGDFGTCTVEMNNMRPHRHNFEWYKQSENWCWKYSRQQFDSPQNILQETSRHSFSKVHTHTRVRTHSTMCSVLLWCCVGPLVAPVAVKGELDVVLSESLLILSWLVEFSSGLLQRERERLCEEKERGEGKKATCRNPFVWLPRFPLAPHPPPRTTCPHLLRPITSQAYGSPGSPH